MRYVAGKAHVLTCHSDGCDHAAVAAFRGEVGQDDDVTFVIARIEQTRTQMEASVMLSSRMANKEVHVTLDSALRSFPHCPIKHPFLRSE